jgi:NitT/TauT family transport system substrate-binding protein
MNRTTSPRPPLLSLSLLLAALLVLAGCGGNSGASGGSNAQPQPKTTVRLGYLSNVTHATAIAGIESGIFARDLGPNADLKPSTFNAGPAEVEALFSQALDAAYMGPNPAVNAFIQSHGEAVQVISGATSGGASLVVQPSITNAQGLRGKKVASPQLGNTQDVSLRSWLKSQGFKTDAQGGGDVSVLPEDNAQTLDAFRQGQIAGAWVPEPWATELVQEAGGKVLVDERDLWPNRQFATTLLVVRTAFLKQHPDVVLNLLHGQVDATAYVNNQPADAQKLVNAALQRITGHALKPDELATAWGNMTFTNDPITSSLPRAANSASSLGLLNLNGVDLSKIWNLGPLNQVLKAVGQPPVQAQ